MPLTIIRPTGPTRCDHFKTRNRELTQEIVVSYALTPPDPRVDLRIIDELHGAQHYMAARCHYLVRMNGLVEIGRDPNTISSHPRKHSEDQIIIMLVGGLDDDGRTIPTETPAQREALEELMQTLANTLNVPLEVDDRVQKVADYAANKEAMRALEEAESGPSARFTDSIKSLAPFGRCATWRTACGSGQKNGLLRTDDAAAVVPLIGDTSIKS